MGSVLHTVTQTVMGCYKAETSVTRKKSGKSNSGPLPPDNLVDLLNIDLSLLLFQSRTNPMGTLHNIGFRLNWPVLL